MKQLFTALMLAFLFGGCGSQTPMGTVSGHVALDGQPLDGAMVVFENLQTGYAASANLAADGSFAFDTASGVGLPIGQYGVAVQPGAIGSGEAPLVGEREDAPKRIAIPARYHSSKTSLLTATVVEGDNPPFEFQLTP